MINEDGILDDAVIFHDELNPAIWEFNKMKPDIREALLRMAEEFKDFLGVDDLNLLDITVSGSNAAFSYTPHSDVDLHLVVSTPEDMTKLMSEFFDAKKNLYNLTRNQKVKGYDVEFYVQNVKDPVKSLGIYSILSDEWQVFPIKQVPAIDDTNLEAKVKMYEDMIGEAIKGDSIHQLKGLMAEIREMRKSGLEKGGEFSIENLAFKVLRTRGLVGQLHDRIIELRDTQLSVESVQIDENDDGFGQFF